jgi:hypothetical protein
VSQAHGPVPSICFAVSATILVIAEDCAELLLKRCNASSNSSNSGLSHGKSATAASRYRDRDESLTTRIMMIQVDGITQAGSTVPVTGAAGPGGCDTGDTESADLYSLAASGCQCAIRTASGTVALRERGVISTTSNNSDSIICHDHDGCPSPAGPAGLPAVRRRRPPGPHY